MQNRWTVFGLVAIFLIGGISHGMADSDEQYLELKKIYDEQRWELEKEFKEKFRESSDTFQQDKQDIFDNSDSDPTLTEEQISQMLREVFSKFVDRQEDIKEEYASRVNALNEMFAKKFQEFDTIPIWVKKVIKFWNEGRISDSEYVNYLSYLINNGIIKSEQLMFVDYDGYVMLTKAK